MVQIFLKLFMWWVGVEITHFVWRVAAKHFNGTKDKNPVRHVVMRLGCGWSVYCKCVEYL